MKYNYKKKYGQNFLNNQSIVDKIIKTINPDERDLIIEIGLGTGALTKELVKLDSDYLGYEIDEETKPYLKKIVPLKNIIFDDFLTRDIKKDIKGRSFRRLYIMGNLPYYITTPIIQKILESDIGETEIVVMVQKEVADRLCSSFGCREYGYITVLLNCFYKIEYLIDVDRSNFEPIPNVDSAVIKLIRKNVKSFDYEELSNFLKTAFRFKRKTLKNNLKGYDLEQIEKILNDQGYSLRNRAEEIPFYVYINVINKYNNIEEES